jgi:Family of unknown function (DUF5309)
MAQIANSYETYDAAGIREELSEQIFRISPEETPFVSNIGREGVDNTYFEWQNDALLAVDLNNNQIEGNDYTSFAAAQQTSRLGNYAQISAKTLIVTGTQERVKKAGRKSEIAYQLALRGAELKRDIESIACQNQLAAPGSGNGATNRKTAGFEAFLRTNVSRGATGASSTLSGGTSGYPSAAFADGTQRAWSEALLKTVAAQIWTSGGTLKMLIVGGTQKQNTSAFAGIAVNRFQLTTPKMGAIIGAADVYVSDFGELQIVPSRFSRNRTALFVDPERAALVFLRPMAVTELAKTGDAEKRLLLAEWGLKIYHEGGHGAVADLT